MSVREREMIQVDHPLDYRIRPIQNETAEGWHARNPTHPPQPPPKASVKEQMKCTSYQGNWLEKTRGNLMIVATVIASMAFQAAINPPSGLTKSTDTQVKECSARLIWDDIINKRILDARNLGITCIQKYSSQEFIIFNTISFSASLSIIFLLTVLPLRRKISMWILLVAISISLIFMAATYMILISLAEGPNPDRLDNQILLYYMVFWVLMLVIIIVILVLQFLFWLLKKLITGIYHIIKFICRPRKKLQELRVNQPPAFHV